MANELNSGVYRVKRHSMRPEEPSLATSAAASSWPMISATKLLTPGHRKRWRQNPTAAPLSVWVWAWHLVFRLGSSDFLCSAFFLGSGKSANLRAMALALALAMAHSFYRPLLPQLPDFGSAPFHTARYRSSMCLHRLRLLGSCMGIRLLCQYAHSFA